MVNDGKKFEDVYSRCTACNEELNDEDKKMNFEKGNLYFPVCLNCIDGFTKEIIEEI